MLRTTPDRLLFGGKVAAHFLLCVLVESCEALRLKLSTYFRNLIDIQGANLKNRTQEDISKSDPLFDDYRFSPAGYHSNKTDSSGPEASARTDKESNISTTVP